MKQYNYFNVSEWLDYLENRHQQEIQLGLSRIKQVAQSLELLQPQAKIITVAGTNGKGSTLASLEALYMAAGYQVASYSSPHLLVFNERIKVNQQPISDQQLCDAFCIIEHARGDIHLTYFEMVTLAGLWYFEQHQLDLIILEVGLGGRLDATNIIDADLAIITTVDFDHQEFLGHTREAIGYEKAGILRANKPFIFADNDPPASVIKQAMILSSPLYLYGRDYNCLFTDTELQFVFQGQVIYLPRPHPHLHLHSVAAAIMASVCLKASLPINNTQLVQGIKNISLSGRLELVKNKVLTLFDVAHNPQAAHYLAKFIKKLQPIGVVHAVFSALKDKNIAGLLEPLLDCVDHWYPAMLTSKRAASQEQLTSTFAIYGIIVPCYDNPLSAYQVACNQAGVDDLIVIYGSFITVGNVLSVVNSLKVKEIQ